jgi:release factor glutamine methyltransferase
VRVLPFPGVFKPHSDSLLLARRLSDEALTAGASVLDLCTGSGVLAIAAARAGARKVVAVDVSRRAVVAARLNARLNGVRLDAVRGDLFAPVRGERFDLIVSNPPYIPSAGDRLPAHGLSRAWEAGPHGRAFLDRICAEGPAHLVPGGTILLVHSSVCSEAATVRALSEQGLEVRVLARMPGPLGGVLSTRAPMLRERGLLGGEDSEEIVIVKARAPVS